MQGLTVWFERPSRFFLAVFFALPMLSQAAEDYESNNTQQDATLLVVGNPTPQQHTLDPDQDAIGSASTLSSLRSMTLKP